MPPTYGPQNLPVLNPLKYGCVFDGLTDDAAGWAALMADVPATGANVLCPPAVSAVGSPIVLPSAGNVTLLGTNAGWNGASDSGVTSPGTVLKALGAHSILQLHKTTGQPVNTGLRVGGIGFDGNGVGTRGIDWMRVAYAGIDSCWFKGFSEASIYFEGTLVSTVTRCSIQSLGKCVWMRSTQSDATIDPNLNLISQCVIDNNYAFASGLHAEHAQNLRVENCNFAACAGDGDPSSAALWYHDGATSGDGVGLVATNLYLESNRGRADIVIDSTNHYCGHVLSGIYIAQPGVSYPSSCVLIAGGGGGINDVTLFGAAFIQHAPDGVLVSGANAHLHAGPGNYNVTNSGGTVTTWG